jgi:DNA-binding MarR family transcriptional regulator
MDEPIGYLLKRAQAALRLRMDQALAARGVTTPQYAALSALEAEPGISNADLARKSFVTPQTMIRIVENLESLGLVVREPHPTHGRVLLTTLSPKGKRLVASCHEDVDAVQERMLNGLGRRDRALFSDFLRRCGAALGASSEE